MAQEYSLNLGLDVVPQTKDPDNLGDIYRLYNAAKALAYALDAYTGAIGASAEDYNIAGTEFLLLQRMSRVYLEYGANATAGQLLAINSSGKLVLGTIGNVVAWSPSGGTLGQFGEARLLGLHSAVSGLTPGISYYASSTPGAITSSVTAQKVGVAMAANKLMFNPA